jgi:hypothetical protein
VFESWLQLVLTLGVTLVLFASVVVAYGGWLIRQEQLSAEQRGYRNRATICRLQLGLGLSLDDNCLDPALAPYFSAHENVQTISASTSLKVLRVVCTELAAQHVQAPECG